MCGKLVIVHLVLLALLTRQSSTKAISLTGSSLDKALTDHKDLIVLFKSGHPICQNITAWFHNVSQVVLEEGGIQLGILQYQKDPGVFQKYRVSTVPQVLVFKSGQRLEEYTYNDIFNQTSEALREWILEKSMTQLQRVDSIHKYNQTHILDIGCEHQKQLLALKLIDNHNEYFCTKSALEGYSMGDILLVTPDDIFKYDNQAYQNVSEWVSTYQDGYVKPLTDYSIHHLLNDNVNTFILLTHIDPESANILPVYKQNAKQHLGSKTRFIHCNIKDNLQLQVQMLNMIGHLEGYPYPHISYLQFGQNLTKYHPDFISSKNITKWVQSVLEGKQKPYIKNVDREQDDDPSVFSSLGHNNLADIREEYCFFVYFYSDYCEGCVVKLGDLKTELKINRTHSKHYLKYSITENDIPNFVKVDSVPTLVLFNNSQLTYLQGEHTVENMKQFILKHNREMHPQDNDQVGDDDLTTIQALQQSSNTQNVDDQQGNSPQEL